MENGESREYEGDKRDVEALSVHIEAALRNQSTSVSKAASPVGSAFAPAAPSIPSSPTAGPAKIAVALYGYTPVEDGELLVKENDMLIVLDTSDPDWWLVKHINKHGEGLVPMTYVEIQTPGVKKPIHKAEMRHQREEEEEMRQRQEEEMRQRQEEEMRQRQEEEMRQRQEEEMRQRQEEEMRQRQEEMRQRQERRIKEEGEKKEERARQASPIRPKVLK
jgi:hypothetical protein